MSVSEFVQAKVERVTGGKGHPIGAVYIWIGQSFLAYDASGGTMTQVIELYPLSAGQDYLWDLRDWDWHASQLLSASKGASFMINGCVLGRAFNTFTQHVYLTGAVGGYGSIGHDYKWVSPMKFKMMPTTGQVILQQSNLIADAGINSTFTASGYIYEQV